MTDVSFISLRLVFQPCSACCSQGMALAGAGAGEPQFEVGDRVGKGGVVREPDAHRDAIELVMAAGTELGWHPRASWPRRSLDRRETMSTLWLAEAEALLPDLKALVAETLAS